MSPRRRELCWDHRCSTSNTSARRFRPAGARGGQVRQRPQPCRTVLGKDAAGITLESQLWNPTNDPVAYLTSTGQNHCAKVQLGRCMACLPAARGCVAALTAAMATCRPANEGQSGCRTCTARNIAGSVQCAAMLATSPRCCGGGPGSGPRSKRPWRRPCVPCCRPRHGASAGHDVASRHRMGRSCPPRAALPRRAGHGDDARFPAALAPHGRGHLAPPCTGVRDDSDQAMPRSPGCLGTRAVHIVDGRPWACDPSSGLPGGRSRLSYR